MKINYLFQISTIVVLGQTVHSFVDTADSRVDGGASVPLGRLVQEFGFLGDDGYALVISGRHDANRLRKRKSVFHQN